MAEYPMKPQAPQTAHSGVVGIPLHGAAWSSGLCGCAEDKSICLQTVFCPWCTQSSVISKLDTDVGQVDWGLCAFLFCGSVCTRGVSELLIAMSVRRQTLYRYNIHEPYATSCSHAACCLACSHCQVQRELSAHGHHAGGACADGTSMRYYARGPPPPVVPFATGLLDCGCVECLDSYFCHPCVIAHMATRLNALDAPVPAGSPGGAAEEPGMTCNECSAACFGGAMVTYAMRREFVQRYGVGEADALSACLLSLFCGPCAASQMRREMGVRGHWPGGVLLSDPPESVCGASQKLIGVSPAALGPSSGHTHHYSPTMV